MESKIIALSGKKRSGKDVSASFIKQYCHEKQLTVERMAFADPVKQVTAISLGLPIEYFFNDDSKEELFSFYDKEKITGRKILQKVGTECLRGNLNDSIWITAIQNKILNSKSNVIVITDLRFENEFSFIKEIGGICIRINRGDIENSDTHISETALDNFKFDYTINNKKGDLIFLQNEIHSILNEIEK